jgi:hypothetical protein
MMHTEATRLPSAAVVPPVVVHPFDPADARRWDDFVARCPEATFFHRIGWRAIIEDIFRHRCH